MLLPVLYVVSFGPACWLCTRDAFSVHVITRAYQPILQLAMRGPESLRRFTMGYASLGASRDCRIGIGLTRVYSDYEATFHIDRPPSLKAAPRPL